MITGHTVHFGNSTCLLSSCFIGNFSVPPSLISVFVNDSSAQLYACVSQRLLNSIIIIICLQLLLVIYFFIINGSTNNIIFFVLLMTIIITLLLCALLR